MIFFPVGRKLVIVQTGRISHHFVAEMKCYQLKFNFLIRLFQLLHPLKVCSCLYTVVVQSGYNVSQRAVGVVFVRNVVANTEFSN